MSRKECVFLRVMLVEDDDGFRRSVAGLLTSKFPSLVIGEAGSGDEAIEKVKSFLPHLIFMDIKLPGQSGLEVTKRIKGLYPDMVVVILTSYDFPEYRDAARASGACGFLSKGTSTAEDLQEIVEGVWGKSSALIEQVPCKTEGGRTCD